MRCTGKFSARRISRGDRARSFLLLHRLAGFLSLHRQLLVDPATKMPTILDSDAAFSSPVDRREIKAHGSFTICPVRRPHNLKAFEEAWSELRSMWQEYLQDDFVRTNMSTEDPVNGDFCGIAYPATKPYRVKAFTQLYVFMFMLDGKFAAYTVPSFCPVWELS